MNNCVGGYPTLTIPSPAPAGEGMVRGKGVMHYRDFR